MRQLTGLDAQFLAMESPSQCGHVSMLLELDASARPGGPLTIDDIQALIDERLPLLPPFRWRLRTVPLGLDYPYWVEHHRVQLLRTPRLRDHRRSRPGPRRVEADRLAA